MSQKADSTKRKQSFLNRLMSSINFLVTEDTNTSDQRTTPRIECRAEVDYVDENGSKGKGYLVDISRSGLQLETTKKLAKGLTLALNAPQGERLEKTAPFMARVRWTRKGKNGDFRAGLALPPGVEDDPHWLEALLSQLGYVDDGNQRRRFIRSDSDLLGRLKPSDGNSAEVPVKVLNLGMGGALLRSDQILAPNLQFGLVVGPYQDLPSITLNGTILRAIENEESFHLYPTRFSLADERESAVLQEYILHFRDESAQDE